MISHGSVIHILFSICFRVREERRGSLFEIRFLMKERLILYSLADTCPTPEGKSVPNRCVTGASRLCLRQCVRRCETSPAVFRIGSVQDQGLYARQRSLECTRFPFLVVRLLSEATHSSTVALCIRMGIFLHRGYYSVNGHVSDSIL